MNLFYPRTFLTAAIALVFAATPASALTTIQITGTIDSLVKTGGPPTIPPTFPISVNDPFTVTMIVDPAAPDVIDPGNPDLGGYVLSSFVVDVGPYSYQTSTGIAFLVGNDILAGPLDAIEVLTDASFGGAPAAAPSLNGFTYNPPDGDDSTIAFVLPPGTFSSDSLPDALGLMAANPGLFLANPASGFSFEFQGPDPTNVDNVAALADITNITVTTMQTGVPEPVTAILGLMGLGVLGMATRRRVA